jgi:hypothetical protein
VTANRIAAWNGATWSALGSGMDGEVKALIEFDDGSGPALYAGGLFTTAGGMPAGNIARWKGGAWAPVAGGLPGLFVQALAIHDAGQGPRLYAAGSGSTTLRRLDPSGWTPVPNGSTAAVNCLASLPAGPLAGLLLGTETDPPNQAGDSFLMRLGCPNIVSWPGCAGPGALLSSSASTLPLGQTLPLAVDSASTLQGSASLFVGALGINGSGCGLALAPGNELLLALVPAPVALAVAALQAGSADLSLTVPATPALAGKKAALQSLVVGPGTALGFQLSNALEVLLGP